MYYLTNLYNNTIKKIYATIPSLFKWIPTVEGIAPTAIAITDPNAIPIMDPSAIPITDPNATTDAVAYIATIVGASVGIIVPILYLFIAVLVVNDMIFMPWIIRLFVFVYIFLFISINPILLIGIPSYYAISALSSVYHNYSLPATLTPVEKLVYRKPLLPVLKGILPLRTWKTDTWMSIETFLSFINYKAIRAPPATKEERNKMVPPLEIAEVRYRNSKMDNINYLQRLVPDYLELVKSEYGQELLKSYTAFMSTLNYAPVTRTIPLKNPVAPPVRQTVQTVPIVLETPTMFENPIPLKI